MEAEAAVEVLREWGRQRGDEYRAHFEQAYSYLRETVSELASDDATWTITPHADHAVLLLAGETAFATVAFSGPPDGVTMKGALHPLNEGVVRVSFNDKLAADEVEIMPGQHIRPTVREWSFDWHGRLQMPLAYWLPGPWRAAAELIQHHERQRATAYKLARAAGWPLPPEGASAAAPSAA